MKRLEVEGLGFSRKGRGLVLGDVTFSVERGSILSILGANGAGKTTLLSLLGGRLSPTHGRIVVDGQGLESLGSRKISRTIAFLPQIERLPFNYKVLDFVLMGRTPHVAPLSQPSAADERLAGEALSELGLGTFLGRNAGELSGGEFQLVRIARCLAQEADLLLLDEPTSLLDPANSRRIASELASLSRKGKTIVFTTHDIALAQFLSDATLVLGNKGILRAGPPSEVLTPEFLDTAFGARFRSISIPSVYADMKD